MEQTQKLELSKFYWLALLVCIGFLVYLLAPVLMPFIVAGLLAYLGDPLVDRLEAKKLPRTVAVIIVFSIIFLVLLALPVILLPLVEQQIAALVTNLPAYIEGLQQFIVKYFGDYLTIDESVSSAELLKSSISQYWKQLGGLASQIVNTITKSGFALVGVFANLILIPVVTFYLLRDWDLLIVKIHDLLPRQYEAKISEIAKDSDSVLGEFLRGQLAVMVALGFIYVIGLWLMGLELALIIGLIAGLVSFVPYLGFIVGIVLASIATIMQFHDATYLIAVFSVFGIGQLLEGFVLTPKLVGDKIGLHPVAVIFAVMAGGQLFGMVGVLLALPVAAVFIVLLRHVHQQYTNSNLYSE